MFAIVFACILGFVVTAADADDDGFVAQLVQEQAGCGNGDEFKGGDDMSIQECADHCGGAGKTFFAHKGEVGACWCAGGEDDGGNSICGWSSVGTSEYNVYAALPTIEVTMDGDVEMVPQSEVQESIDAAAKGLCDQIREIFCDRLHEISEDYMNCPDPETLSSFGRNGRINEEQVRSNRYESSKNMLMWAAREVDGGLGGGVCGYLNPDKGGEWHHCLSHLTKCRDHLH